MTKSTTYLGDRHLLDPDFDAVATMHPISSKRPARTAMIGGQMEHRLIWLE
jgi:hypothetical protein